MYVDWYAFQLLAQNVSLLVLLENKPGKVVDDTLEIVR